MPRIEIALATHNSAKYLRPQMDSLFAQTCQDFTLLVSDDGSSDETLSIIAQYQARFPGRIRILEFPGRAGGAMANFTRLTDAFTADYAMYCDHDDVWLPGKIERSLRKIREAKLAKSKPVLVHTDLSICRPDMAIVSHSRFSYERMDPAKTKLRHLLVHNAIVGCTVLINRALYELARPIPNGALMHDSWLALVASSFGEILYDAEPSVLYRQHSRNAIGSERWGLLSTARRAVRFANGNGTRNLRAKAVQARSFLDRYGRELTPQQAATVETLADLRRKRRFARPATLLLGGLSMQGLLRTSGLLLSSAMLD